MSHLSIQPSSFRIDIQGIRGFAFLLVFFFHLYPNSLPSGLVGVDIFFVLSGYVITSSLINTEIVSSFSFLLNFFRKRCLRLLPALIFALFFTFICLALFIPPSPSKDFYQFNLTGLSALFGLSNLFLQRQALDYFGDITTYNPFLQTWSLSIEFQFYLVYPLLFLFSSFFDKRNYHKYLFIAILLFLTIASFCAFITGNLVDSYYSLPLRFWELSIGCLAFYACSSLNRRFNVPNALRSSGHLLYIFSLSLLSFTPSSSLTISLAVLFTSVILLFPSTNSLFSSPILTSIGLYSYSLYLFHWPIICFLRWTIHPPNIFFPIITIILLIPISFFSFIFFEVKTRSFINSHFNWSKIIYLYIFGFIISIAPSFSRFVGFSTYIGFHDFRDVDELSWTVNSFESDNDIPPQTPKLLVLGNSHARHFLPMLTEFSRNNNFYLLYDEFDTRHIVGELDLLNYLVDLKSQLSVDDYVVISSAFISEDDNLSEQSSKFLYDKWYHTLSLIKADKDDSPKFIFLLNSPRFVGVMPYFPLCFKESFRPFPPNCQLSGLQDGFSHEPIFSLISNLSLQYSNIYYINLSRQICPDSSNCSNYLGSTLLMRDSTHFNYSGSMFFYNTFSSLVLD